MPILSDSRFEGALRLGVDFLEGNFAFSGVFFSEWAFVLIDVERAGLDLPLEAKYSDDVVTSPTGASLWLEYRLAMKNAQNFLLQAHTCFRGVTFLGVGFLAG